MLRESGREIPRGISLQRLSKLTMNLRKGDTMEIVKTLYDLASVLVLFGIAMAPRAIGTYLALHKED